MSHFGTEAKEAELCEVSGDSSWQMKACRHVFCFQLSAKFLIPTTIPIRHSSQLRLRSFPFRLLRCFRRLKNKKKHQNNPLFSFVCWAWLPQWPCTVYRIKFSALAYFVQLINYRWDLLLSQGQSGLWGHPPVVSRDKPGLSKTVELSRIGSGRLMWP